MTDARLPERWLSDRRLQRLSPEHYRAFINALMYAVANRTDGQIEQGDLALIPHWSANAAKAFVEAQLFTPQDDGWLITDYVGTQTSRAEHKTLERMRTHERQKKARQRADKAEKDVTETVPETADETPGPSDVSGTVPRDIPGEVLRDDTGKAGEAGRQAFIGGSSQSDSVVPMAAGAEQRWPPAWHGAGPNPYDEYK